jgi:DNA-binding response OmpR family regulator
MSGRAVDLHISRLRRKLSAAGYDGIRTMRFIGYRFVPVEGDAGPAP